MSLLGENLVARGGGMDRPLEGRTLEERNLLTTDSVWGEGAEMAFPSNPKRSYIMREPC